MLKNYCLLKDFTDTLYVNIDNIFSVFTPLSATSTSILRVEQNMAPTDSPNFNRNVVICAYQVSRKFGERCYFTGQNLLKRTSL